MTINNDPKLIPTICAALEEHGFVVIDHAFSASMNASLVEFLADLNLDHFKLAGMGRAQAFHANAEIRSDHIMWLQDNDAKTKGYFEWAECLRVALNEIFYLGLNSYECMFAHYPVSAFYQKHVDAFKQNENKQKRKLSTIYYLNDNWQAGDGGELLLYHLGDAHAFKRILPEMGRLVIFLSEEFPHEVLPAKKSRYSLTGWFKTQS